MGPRGVNSLRSTIILFTICSSISLSSYKLYASAQYSDFPTYGQDASLTAPKHFEQWVFVGSNLGLVYKPNIDAMTSRESIRSDPPRFHNVYINKSAYDYYSQHRTFPDGTTLIMELFEASNSERQGILAAGTFDGRRVGLEVAVKNSSRPDRSKTQWAYYDFTDDNDPSKSKESATAFPDSSCENCHHIHAGFDNVWIQFYPVLRSVN